MKTLVYTVVCSIASLVAVWAGVHALEGCDSWRIVPTPNPGFGNNALLDVAAHSSSDVWAVGSSGTGPFVLRWDGRFWSESELPDLSKIGSSFALDAAGAIPGGGIWTVGIIQIHVWNAQPLVIRHHGTDWDFAQAVELQPQQVWPYAERNGHALAVDALNENDAWAVGVADGMGTGVGGPPPLTIHWDGTEWVEVMTTAPGGRQNNLYGVAMVAPDDAWAVGEYSGSISGFRALVMHWDGTEWNSFPNPAEQIQSTHLYDIVAIAPDDIWAVGSQPGDALFMHWDGTSWMTAESPVDEFMTIGQIDAYATDDVWASGASAYAEQWFFHYDGTSWTPVTPAEVFGSQGMAIGGGLAVTGPCAAWAVGSWFDGSWGNALVEKLRPRSIFERPPVRLQ